MIFIVMGVSGCGKTTVGRLLAEALGLPFYDADHFHPPENVAKMSRGIALDEADRLPWLERLAGKMADWEATGGAVLACSALKEHYRRRLGLGQPHVRFIYLKGSRDLILARMRARRDHYMPASLLDSQFAALEEPAGVLTVSIDASPERIAQDILDRLG
ncbi:MAG: gluconokinase [bacterium]|nr:gluconokinase [bacterium]